MRTLITLSEEDIREACFRFVEDKIEEAGFSATVKRETGVFLLRRDAQSGEYVAEITGVLP